MTQKYTTQDGIRKYNPAWSPSQPTTATAIPTATAFPFINQSTALPVIPAPTATYLDEEEIVIVPTSAYDAAVVQYHQEAEPEIYLGGYQGEGDSLDELNAILAKYEVPCGMLAKLLELRQFDVAEIIVDDSGSMRRMTDAKDPSGAPMTRWWEAKYRISQMVEIMAYVPCAPIHLYFLNRRDVLLLERGGGEVPSAYIQRAEGVLTQAFQQAPAGGTPALQAIQASLSRNANRRVLRYFMGDGVPNGGAKACEMIQTLIMNRPFPKNNPFTFMSCTNEDAQVEWMKTTEEKALYCAEFDDYLDEAREVLRDQGKAFPYSFGLHLVAQVVAAFNPHDLDAMDESVPFTKRVFDDLLGYRTSSEEYRYYFESFIEAQKKLPGYTRAQPRFQRQFVDQLPRQFTQFQSAAVATDIPEVVQYKRKLSGPSARGHGDKTSRQRRHRDCIIL